MESTYTEIGISEKPAPITSKNYPRDAFQILRMLNKYNKLIGKTRVPPRVPVFT